MILALEPTSTSSMAEQVHAWLNSATSLIGIIGVIWLAAVKITRLEERVGIIWAMLLKRAVVEGVDRGLLEVNSPVRLTSEAADMLQHDLATKLHELWKTKGASMGERDFIMEIERNFGDVLVHEVCIPNKISFGVCLLIAAAVAKGERTLTEILDEYHIPKKPMDDFLTPITKSVDDKSGGAQTAAQPGDIKP